MTPSTAITRFDRAFLARLADWFAVAVAMALQWSTSALGACILAWLITLLPRSRTLIFNNGLLYAFAVGVLGGTIVQQGEPPRSGDVKRPKKVSVLN